MFKKKGFTLIELMVVIAIIAVLAAVVTPQVFNQIARGRASAAISFAQSVNTASTSFFADIGSWPPSCTQATCNNNPAPGNIGNFVANSAVANARWLGPYLQNWPTATRNPWGGNYQWNISPALGSANFNAALAQERWITITFPNASSFADGSVNLDRARDNGDGGAAGYVRYGAASPVLLLISRDGPVS